MNVSIEINTSAHSNKQPTADPGHHDTTATPKRNGASADNRGKPPIEIVREYFVLCPTDSSANQRSPVQHINKTLARNPLPQAAPPRAMPKVKARLTLIEFSKTSSCAVSVG